MEHIRIRKNATFRASYPKFKSIRVMEPFSKLTWIVTLNDGKEHTVAFGNLRKWLEAYAI